MTPNKSGALTQLASAPEGGSNRSVKSRFRLLIITAIEKITTASLRCAVLARDRSSHEDGTVAAWRARGAGLRSPPAGGTAGGKPVGRNYDQRIAQPGQRLGQDGPAPRPS